MNKETRKRFLRKRIITQMRALENHVNPRTINEYRAVAARYYTLNMRLLRIGYSRIGTKYQCALIVEHFSGFDLIYKYGSSSEIRKIDRRPISNCNPRTLNYIPAL